MCGCTLWSPSLGQVRRRGMDGYLPGRFLLTNSTVMICKAALLQVASDAYVHVLEPTTHHWHGPDGKGESGSKA